MRDKSRVKHVMVQAKVSCDTAERLDNIVNEEEKNRDVIAEFAKLFEGFENKRNRIITTKPKGVKSLKLVNSIYIFSEVGKKGYVARNMKVDAEGVKISNRSNTSISNVIKYLYPKLAEKLDSIGRKIDSNRYEEIIDYILEEMNVKLMDGIGEEVRSEMDMVAGVTRYGNVPVKARKREVNDEQGL